MKTQHFECTNCVELEHQSGFYNADVPLKWTVIYGSTIFELLKTIKKMSILTLAVESFVQPQIFILIKKI